MSKILYGVVSSDKADKTITVNIRSRRTHPIYRKQFTVSKRLLAHDENNEAKIGDKVSIVETRPISKRKNFKLEKIIERPIIREDQSVEAITEAKEEKPEKIKKSEPKKAKVTPKEAKK